MECSHQVWAAATFACSLHYRSFLKCVRRLLDPPSMGLALLSAHVQLGRVRISSSSLLWVDLRCSACFASREIQVSLYSALVGLGCREGGAGCRTSDPSLLWELGCCLWNGRQLSIRPWYCCCREASRVVQLCCVGNGGSARDS